MKRTLFLLFISSFVGLLLWVGLFTDYSWSNVWVNVLFAPIVGIIGLIVWLGTRKMAKTASKRWLHLRRLACIPSMLGGLPYLLLIVVAAIPPFILATMFWIGEQKDAILIQQELSPDGHRVAEVYLRPVGAYSGGNGRIEVHLKYTWLPFIKRDIYYRPVSYVSDSQTDYLQWRDNNTLHLSEDNSEISVGFVNFDLPAFILLPLNYIRLMRT